MIFKIRFCPWISQAVFFLSVLYGSIVMALRIFLPGKGCPFNCPPAIELRIRAGNWGRGLFTWKLDENTIDWPTDWPWRKHLIKMLKSYITCIQLCGRRAMPKFIHAQPIQSIGNQNNFQFICSTWMRFASSS